jgi:hypothetical protein
VSDVIDLLGAGPALTVDEFEQTMAARAKAMKLSKSRWIANAIRDTSGNPLDWPQRQIPPNQARNRVDVPCA